MNSQNNPNDSSILLNQSEIMNGNSTFNLSMKDEETAQAVESIFQKIIVATNNLIEEREQIVQNFFELFKVIYVVK